METFDDRWIGFEKACVPADAGQQQRHDMRMSFYAGALAFIACEQAVTGMVVAEGKSLIDAAVKIKELRAEVMSYSQALTVLGRAQQSSQGKAH